MQISNINLSPTRDNLRELRRAVSRKSGIPESSLPELRITRRSIDARRRDRVSIIYSVALGEPVPELPQPTPAHFARRPVVVGSGPAGMMCALTLAQAGARPIVLERGLPVELRVEAVERYFSGGALDPECNVQFGEGGAGTFSDGKLTTGVRDPRIARVIREFIDAGAPSDIAYQARAHIGTDLLRSMVAAIRAKVESLGGEYRFSSRLSDVIIKNGAVAAAVVSHDGAQYELECDTLIAALGHSARDTFEMLLGRGAEMTQKAFSIGARIEHPQSMIDAAQYGSFAGMPSLGAADYKLSHKTAGGRGVYTFCMCPGGAVVAAASEPDSIVTNGMSLRARDLPCANSALLVGVGPSDFGSEHPLAGIYMQRSIERAAFAATGSSRAPAQLVGDFLSRRASAHIGSVKPSYMPGVAMGSIDCCLPAFITDAMREGITVFARKLRGFDLPDAVLTAPETRSSSPVRIVRDDTLQSNIRGLFPCGEGAGYAGGIMSAAVDGIRCAEGAISQYGS